MTYESLGAEVGRLVATKQRAYGDAFGRAGPIMRILYPRGVPPAALDDALAVVRVLDKLFRIATDRDALGESPWQDIVGYGLLALARTNRERSARGLSGAGGHAGEVPHEAGTDHPGAGHDSGGDFSEHAHGADSVADEGQGPENHGGPGEDLRGAGAHGRLYHRPWLVVVRHAASSLRAALRLLGGLSRLPTVSWQNWALLASAGAQRRAG
jgi:hypothetical protein